MALKCIYGTKCHDLGFHKSQNPICLPIVDTPVLIPCFPPPALVRFGSVACGVGQELYVFGGVRSKEQDNPEQRQMLTCKSEFYHDDMRRSVRRKAASSAATCK